MRPPTSRAMLGTPGCAALAGLGRHWGACPGASLRYAPGCHILPLRGGRHVGCVFKCLSFNDVTGAAGIWSAEFPKGQKLEARSWELGGRASWPPRHVSA
jgi:hypothetical protein